MVAKFISGIWQIHPFCEGNTRTTAVFMIKYLQTFGFNVSNQVFAENSRYFRNALVRANFNDLQNNIHSTTVFLEQFMHPPNAATIFRRFFAGLTAPIISIQSSASCQISPVELIRNC